MLHCCAQTCRSALLQPDDGAALSFDLDMLGDAGARRRRGVGRLGPARSGSASYPASTRRPSLDRRRSSTKRLLAWWSTLGYSDVETLPATTVTPSCGLAGASPAMGRTAHELVAEVARNLSEEQGKIAL